MQFQDLEAEQQIKLINRMIHGHPHGIIAINKNFKICATNQKLCRESGYSPRELYGEDLHILIEELKHEQHRNHLKKWFDHPVKVPLNKRGQLYLKTYEGKKLKVQIDIYPIEDWQNNGMFQPSEVVKPTLYGCAAIVFQDE